MCINVMFVGGEILILRVKVPPPPPPLISRQVLETYLITNNLVDVNEPLTISSIVLSIIPQISINTVSTIKVGPSWENSKEMPQYKLNWDHNNKTCHRIHRPLSLPLFLSLSLSLSGYY